MALDLGTLMGYLDIDDSGLDKGLKSSQQKVERWGPETSTKAERAGQMVGAALVRGLTGRIQDAQGNYVRQGETAGRGYGEGVKRGAGRGLSGLKSVVASGGAAFAGLGAAGVGALGLVGAAAGGMGLKVAAGNEQAEISFSTMLGSAKKAGAFLDDLKQFAASTPFEFPELQTAASSLISAGINADKVIPIMRTLGDVTSGMGTGSEGVQRATVALQQMSAAGRITGEDLNQLRDAGIPVYDLLSKATGKSKAEVVKLAQAGKLGKKELGEMMGALESGKGLERFSGLMDKQSQSLTGVLSTLKDTAGQGLAEAVQPGIPVIKAAIGSASSELAKVVGWVDKNKTSISGLFDVARSSVGTFGRVAQAAFVPFIGGLTKGRATFADFAGFVQTHQEDITGGLVAGARMALGFAGGLGKMAVFGLRAYGVLFDAQADLLTQANKVYGGVLHAAASAFGWIPGLGDKLKAADASFAQMSTSAVDSLHKAGAGSRAAADGLESRLLPAIDKARANLDKVGNTEIAKAKLRDSAARAGLAIEAVGTKANGAQLKLKDFRGSSDRSTAALSAFRGRLMDASRSLGEQVEAARKAGVGQKELTKTWEEGKKKLYDEFLQMGYSKTQAQKLADKYAGIKPKVSTKFETPGMVTAQDNAKTLKKNVDDIPNRKNVVGNLTFKTNASGVVANLNKQFQLVKGGPKMTLAGGGPANGTTRKVRHFDGGGAVQDFSGRGRQSYDTEEALLRVDEHVWTPEEVDGAGGHDEMRRMRRAARRGLLHRAGGGSVPSLAGVDSAHSRAASRGVDNGSQMLAFAVSHELTKLVKATKAASTASAGKIDVSNPHGHTSYRGGTFTNLFAANLRRAEKIAHQSLSVYQGGFRPSTSYSGTSHRGDAIDNQPSAAIIRALRAVGIASGDRTGLGNWMSHAHGVPTPGAGYGAGSAVWQAQDYKRRGGARQGLHSPWGLYTGTDSASPGFHWTAEKGAELVVNPQLKRYSGGEKVLNAQQTSSALGGSAQLAEQLHLHLEQRGSVREDMAEVKFRLRDLQRGGVHRGAN